MAAPARTKKRSDFEICMCERVMTRSLASIGPSASAALLADAILVLHFAFVVGVLISIPLILLGALFGWKWVRNPWFRKTHLALISIVLIETIVGIFCPLTVWERILRERAGQDVSAGSFIERWVGRLLYYDFPPWVFTAAYFAVGAIIVGLYFAVPPRRSKL